MRTRRGHFASPLAACSMQPVEYVMRDEPIIELGISPAKKKASPFAGIKQKLEGHTPYSILIKLAKQPTLRATAAFALSGLAFAVGTLLLARSMPVEAFGHFALAIALFNVFGLLAPIGVDQVLLRHRVDPGAKLLLQLTATGISVGAVVGLGYMVSAGLHYVDAAALCLAIIAGGVIATLASLARAAMQEAHSLLLVTAASWILIMIGVASLAFPMESALLPLCLFAIGNAAVAIWGWSRVDSMHRVPMNDRVKIPWNEAFSLLGIAAIGTIMLQLERLIIPATIGIQALALFSVLASVAIFPFRLLTASAGFSMVPKLRAASSLRMKRKLVRTEFFFILSLLFAATIAIVTITPYATHLLTGGRYEISLNLVVAACMNGCAKVLQALPRAILTGCGNDRDIALLNRLGTLGLMASIVGAFIGAQWALAGLLYGVAIGSMVGSVPAIQLARRSMR